MMKKSVGLFFASLMLLSVLSFVVSAQSIFTPVVDFAKSIGSDWNQGNGFSFGVAKLFVSIIILVLIIGVLDKFPGLSGDELSKKYMRFFLALAITFLATAYFTATELAVVVTSYSALGFVLGGIVPFLIMVFWSNSVISGFGRGNSGLKAWGLRGLWGLFGAYFLYKVLSAGGSTGIDGSSWVIWGQWALIAVSFVVVLFTPFFIRKVVQEENLRIGDLAVEDARLRADLRTEKATDIAALKNRINKAKRVV